MPVSSTHGKHKARSPEAIEHCKLRKRQWRQAHAALLCKKISFEDYYLCLRGRKSIRGGSLCYLASSNGHWAWDRSFKETPRERNQRLLDQDIDTILGLRPHSLWFHDFATLEAGFMAGHSADATRYLATATGRITGRFQ